MKYHRERAVSCGNGEDRVSWLALKNRSGGAIGY